MADTLILAIHSVNKRSLCSFLLYERMRWTVNVTQPMPAKFVACMAPHTSNWDFVIGILYSRAEGIRMNFLMKHEWFVGPLDKFFHRLGGIPVWREKHTSMTDVLAEEAANAASFRLCVTPEGTRKRNPDWKRGFYYIALKAHIPILLFGLDYKKRVVQCTKTVIPSGDYDSDIRIIKDYYKDFVARHPENFTIGDDA